jgi:hypothetical protein
MLSIFSVNEDCMAVWANTKCNVFGNKRARQNTVKPAYNDIG